MALPRENAQGLALSCAPRTRSRGGGVMHGDRGESGASPDPAAPVP